MLTFTIQAIEGVIFFSLAYLKQKDYVTILYIQLIVPLNDGDMAVTSLSDIELNISLSDGDMAMTTTVQYTLTSRFSGSKD